jgi:HD superfamily phosphohydrolase
MISSTESDKSDKLDPFVCELIKIAGLTHDLGHGPFSHLFDDVYLPRAVDKQDTNDPSMFHEHRSMMILKKIVENDSLLKECITDDCLKFIQKLINPTGGCDGFVYQIVSNSFNSIDIDKFDYMARDTHMLGLKFGFDYGRLVDEVKVLDNKLCFPDKMNYEVASIFWTRYRLHKQIYSHRSVVSIQYMISDLMRLIDPIIGITETIYDLDKFYDLTDDYVMLMVKLLKREIDQYEEEDQTRINMAYNILQRITSRNIYYLATSFISEEKIYLDIKLLVESGYKVDPRKIIIHKTKIGFVSGNKENPLDNLYFYNHRNPDVCFNLKKEQLSILLPDEYQEHLYMVYVKDKDDKETIKQIENIYDDLDKFI